MKDKLSDKRLVEKFQAGDKEVLSILVNRWHRTFCELAFWQVKNKDVAKDIAQESWNVIINKINDLQQPSKFKFWATSIVNRKSIDWLRKYSIEKQNLYNYEKDSISSTKGTNNDLLKNRLQAGIESLTINQQQVIKLFYLEEYSLEEISKLLQIPKGTVKSRLFTAREKLKTILKNRNHE